MIRKRLEQPKCFYLTPEQMRADMYVYSYAFFHQARAWTCMDMFGCMFTAGVGKRTRFLLLLRC